MATIMATAIDIMAIGNQSVIKQANIVYCAVFATFVENFIANFYRYFYIVMIGLQFVDVVGLTMLVRFDRSMPEIVCTNFIFQIRTHSYLRISVSDFIGKAIKPSLEFMPLRPLVSATVDDGDRSKL